MEILVMLRQRMRESACRCTSTIPRLRAITIRNMKEKISRKRNGFGNRLQLLIILAQPLPLNQYLQKRILVLFRHFTAIGLSTCA